MIPDNYTAKILRTVLRSPGLLSRQIAASLDDALTPAAISSMCRDLLRRGWLVRAPGTTQRRTQWMPSERLRTLGVEAAIRPQVQPAVLTLVEQGQREIPAIARTLQLTHPCVYSAVLQLEAKGQVRRVREGLRTYVEPVSGPVEELEDDHWEAPVWKHPYARASA